MSYRSVQFTLDGSGWIFDYESDTIQGVWDQVNDQGSKWIFYPVPFVVKNIPWQNFIHSRIISAPDGFEFLNGKSINTARKYLKDNTKAIIGTETIRIF